MSLPPFQLEKWGSERSGNTATWLHSHTAREQQNQGLDLVSLRSQPTSFPRPSGEDEGHWVAGERSCSWVQHNLSHDANREGWPRASGTKGQQVGTEIWKGPWGSGTRRVIPEQSPELGLFSDFQKSLPRQESNCVVRRPLRQQGGSWNKAVKLRGRKNRTKQTTKRKQAHPE